MKELPEAGLVSASQNVSLLRGALVFRTITKEDMAEVTGRLRVAPRLPLQELLPESRASQLPAEPTVGWGSYLVPPALEAVVAAGPAVAGGAAVAVAGAG